MSKNTKYFNLVASAFGNDSKGALAVNTLAAMAVKAIYSNPEDGMIKVQIMLDAMTRNYRDSLPAFFRRMGLYIETTKGEMAICHGVKDKAAQAKVFAKLETDFVCDPDAVIYQPRKVKAKVTASVADQKLAANAEAQKAIDALIARVKKTNPYAAAEINSRLSPVKIREVEAVPALTVTGSEDGQIETIDAAEYALIKTFLLKRRMAVLAETPSFDHLLSDEAKAVSIAH